MAASVNRKGNPVFLEGEGAPALIVKRHLPHSNGSTCAGKRSAASRLCHGKCPAWLNGIEDGRTLGLHHALGRAKGTSACCQCVLMIACQ